jgi:hypothetical protein
VVVEVTVSWSNSTTGMMPALLVRPRNAVNLGGR